MADHRQNSFAASLLSVFLILCSCGTAGDILGTQRNSPSARVIGWTKVDLNPDADLAQPFIHVSESDEDFIEPHLMQVDGRFRCYYEALKYDWIDGEKTSVSSKIYAIESDDGLHWNEFDDGLPLLGADQNWEGDFAGAPSIIRIGEEFIMYYAGGRGAGIGEAKSADGIIWIKNENNPVLVPDQNWEEGVIGAPAALFLDGITHLWYSGGANSGNEISAFLGNAIGYAVMESEGEFIKKDASGRASPPNSPNVSPVISPDQKWEGLGEDDLGFVSSPDVVVYKTPLGRVLQMYYTGDEPGQIGHGDASIGFAGSEDGLNWDKADLDVNPVVQEIFAIQISGLSEHLSYDEWGASVLHRDDRSFMIFSQLDPLNWMTSQLKGLAVAVNPPIQ